MIDCQACTAGDHADCDSGAWTPDGRPTACACWADNHGQPDPDEPDPDDLEPADDHLEQAALARYERDLYEPRQDWI